MPAMPSPPTSTVSPAGDPCGLRWLPRGSGPSPTASATVVNTPMDCQDLRAPRQIGQEKPDLTTSATMAVNQHWPRRGTRHHLQRAAAGSGLLD
jgi:hypothetical protein